MLEMLASSARSPVSFKMTDEAMAEKATADQATVDEDSTDKDSTDEATADETTAGKITTDEATMAGEAAANKNVLTEATADPWQTRMP